MRVVLPEPAMPITMHAVGWRVVASVALDEATAGDETVAAAIVTVAAESGTFGPPLVSCRETRYIGVLAYLAQCAPSPVVPRPGDGSYSSTGLPDVYIPTRNHLF